MYIEKKQSKLLLFLCSFLVLISGLLCFNPSWLSKYYDDTLCANVAIDDNYIFVDGYVDYVFKTGTSFNALFAFDVENFGSIPTLYGQGYTFYLINYTDGNNPTYNDSATFSVGSDNTRFSISYNNLPNNFNLLDVSIGYLGSDNYWHIYGSSNYYLDWHYNNAYTDGLIDGRDGVLNNPNDYDLYTEEQYQQSYFDGNAYVVSNPGLFGLYTQEQLDAEYNRGYQAGLNFVINNPGQYDLYTSEELIEYYDTGYSNGVNYVTTNPGQYGLYTMADMNISFTNGYNDGYNVGFTDGENDAYNNVNNYSFRYLISSVVDVPVSTFRSLFNFELLGFNIFNFFCALLTLLVLIALIKFFANR